MPAAAAENANRNLRCAIDVAVTMIPKAMNTYKSHPEPALVSPLRIFTPKIARKIVPLMSEPYSCRLNKTKKYHADAKTVTAADQNATKSET